jgi:hypothetical protein
MRELYFPPSISNSKHKLKNCSTTFKMTGQNYNTKTTYSCGHVLIRCAPEIAPETAPASRSLCSLDTKLSWFKQIKFRVGKSVTPQLLYYIELQTHTLCPDCEKLLILRAVAGQGSGDQPHDRGLLSTAPRPEAANENPVGERKWISLPRRPINNQMPKVGIPRRPLPSFPPPRQDSLRVPIERRPGTSPSCHKPDMRLRPSRDRQTLYKEPETDLLTEEQGEVIWRDVCKLTRQELSESRSSMEDSSGVKPLPIRTCEPVFQSEMATGPERRLHTSQGFYAEEKDARRYAELHHPSAVRVVSQTALICDEDSLDEVSVSSQDFDPSWMGGEVSPLTTPTSSPKPSSWGHKSSFRNDSGCMPFRNSEVDYNFI